MKPSILLAVLAPALLGGCIDHMTDVTVKDPSRVELVAQNNDGSVTPVLPAGKGPTVAAYTSSPPILGKREASGALHVSCDWCEFGDAVLVAADGRFRTAEDVDARELVKAGPDDKGNFQLFEQLTTASSSTQSGNMIYSQWQWISPGLTTPWKNVKLVEDTHHPDRTVGWVWLGVGAGLTAIGLLFASTNFAGHDTFTALFLLPGIGLDVLGGYHAFAPTRHDVVYQNDEPLPPPEEKREASAPAAASPPPPPFASDRDRDTFLNDEDKCPDEAEVFNGVKDDDGCPDTGGRPLVTVDDTQDPPDVVLSTSLKFASRAGQPPQLDSQSVPAARAIAQWMLQHPGWKLIVGFRPAANTDSARQDAAARSTGVVRVIAQYAHASGAAEAIDWDHAKVAKDAVRLGIGLMLVKLAPPPSGPSPTK